MLHIQRYITVLLALLIIAPVSFNANANGELKGDLVSRITQSSNDLRLVEAKVSEESSALQKQLNDLQIKLKKLRSDAQNAQRMNDERVLGFQRLQNRVDEWSTQSRYQNHLLASYLSFINEPRALSDNKEGSLVEEEALTVALEHLENALEPAWMQQNLIVPGGNVQSMWTLEMGPVAVAYDENNKQAGFVNNDTPEQGRIDRLMDEQFVENIGQLKTQRAGVLYFDPSLGNATKLQDHNANALQVLRSGGLWAIPIVFFGLLAFVISVIKGLQLIRLPSIDLTAADRLRVVADDAALSPSATAQQVEKSVRRLVSGLANTQKKLAEIALNTPVSPQRDDLLVAQLMESKYGLERYMGVVATVAAVAPLLGLLGTVSGMISTFKMMTIFGSGDPSTVSGGISEALVTTELGLVVAIPSLIVSALMTRKAKSYAHKLEAFAIKLSKINFHV